MAKVSEQEIRLARRIGVLDYLLKVKTMDFVSAVRHRLSLVVVCWSFVLTTAQKKTAQGGLFWCR